MTMTVNHRGQTETYNVRDCINTIRAEGLLEILRVYGCVGNYAVRVMRLPVPVVEVIEGILERQ